MKINKYEDYNYDKDDDDDDDDDDDVDDDDNGKEEEDLDDDDTTTTTRRRRQRRRRRRQCRWWGWWPVVLVIVIMMTMVTATLKLRVKTNQNTNHFNRLINIFPVLWPRFRLGGSLWLRRLFLFNLFSTLFYKQSIKASIIMKSY